MTPKINTALALIGLVIVALITGWVFIEYLTFSALLWTFGVIVAVETLAFFFMREIIMGLEYFRYVAVKPGEIRESIFDVHQLVQDVLTENPKVFANVGMPQVVVNTHDNSVNAFAAGFHPKYGMVCFTQGFLEQLNRKRQRMMADGMPEAEANQITLNSTKAVIAHELGHLKNLDIPIFFVAGFVMAFLDFLIEVTDLEEWLEETFWGAILGIPLFLLLALSRAREYLADEAAVQCGYGALSDAAILDITYDKTRTVPATKAILQPTYHWIQRKARGALAWIGESLSTHPATYNRIVWAKTLSEGHEDSQGNDPTISSDNWSWAKCVQFTRQANTACMGDDFFGYPRELLDSVPNKFKVQTSV